MSKEELPSGSGTTLSHYLLASPFDGTRDVWIAQDQRLGREVVVKILTRNLPADRTRRDAGIRKARNGASFFHPGIARIIDIDSEGDVLFLVLEKVEGKTIRDAALQDAPGRPTVMKWAWQLADALKAIHAHELVHGAVNDANVIVTAAGDVKLLGTSLKMLIDRRDRGGAELLQRNDEVHLRELSHLAPEQITGKPVDQRADIYSFGVVFYQVATGALPFVEANPTDLANAIVKKQPPMPYEINPRIDPRLAQIIVKAMMKDPWARYESTRVLLEEMKRLEPSIVVLSERAPEPGPGRKAADSGSASDAIIVVADIAYYALIEKKDASRAASIASLLQQIVGESVYLFDGTLLDAMGPRVVATLPTAEAAFRAIEHASRELSEKNSLLSTSQEEVLEPRIVIHAGAITESPLSGRALEEAMQILEQMSPGQLLATGRPIDDAKLAERSRALGTFQNIRLYEPPAVFEEKVEVLESAENAPAGEVITSPEPVTSSRRSRGAWMLAAAAAFGVIASIATWLLMSKQPAEPPVAAAQANVVAKPAAPRLFVDLAVAGVTDETAALLRNASVGIRSILREAGGIEIAESASDATTRLTAKAGADPTQIVPVLSGARPRDLAAIPVTEVVPILRSALSELARELRVPDTSVTTASDEALASFVVAANSAPGSEERAAALRSSLRADPSFEPAARLAIDELNAPSDAGTRIAAADFLLTRDPKASKIRRKVVGWQLDAQQEASAIPHIAALLRENPNDAEMIELAARLALHAGDETRFAKAVERLSVVRSRGASHHAPDALASSGRFDSAITRYYNVQQRDPDNRELALKIGRIAVLRRSLAIAESELAKLHRLDPEYGHPLLTAYIAAEKGDSAAARDALAKAEAASANRGDFEIASAEVNALLSAHGRVLESLARAAARNESPQYILSNPLFGYLMDDPRFARTRAALEQRRETLRSSIQALPL